MLNIISFLLNLINQHVIWLYAACLVVLLLYARSYAQARKDRENTIFTIEKEVAAHREGQAMSGIGFVLGIVAVITAIRFYLVPSLDLSAVSGPTPTFTLAPSSTRTPVPSTPTPTLRPTVATPTPRTTPIVPKDSPTAGVIATVPPTPVPPACPDSNIRITSPGVNAVVRGLVAIEGTANHPRFQFYKVEYALGETPSSWHVIHDIHRTPVMNGLLEELNTMSLPNGVCWIQLTVVDQSGNFPPPCRVRVIIRN